MLGSITYHNPTRLHFGTDAMDALAGELAAFGTTIQLVYGGGSIKKNGIYEQVVEVLKAAGKTVVEDAGVMPNPTIEKLRAAVANPEEYEARSNIMWTATWALNTLIGMGKTQDWEVHMLGQAVGALTDAAHGMTLAATAIPYYRLVMAYGLPKFARFATAVWGIDPAGKSEEELATAGIDAMEAWMREIGCVMSLRELGCDESMLDALADATLVMRGGYHALSREEIIEVFRKAL